VSRVLVVDIGNTTTRVGLWEGREAAEVAVFATGESGAVEALPVCDGLALCSVVSTAEAPWRAWAERNGLELLVIHGDTPAPVINRYSQPAQLGADRLCAAVGAMHLLGAPVIVVSLGTATVVDAVSAARELLGGAIAPGVDTGLAALHEKTAALPRVTAEAPRGPIGDNTEEGLRAGAVLGTAALVEGLVTRMREVVGQAKVAVTGGNVGLVAPHLRGEGWNTYPTLVLEGAGLVWEHHHS
jgi:type III pantothenate kinase